MLQATASREIQRALEDAGTTAEICGFLLQDETGRQAFRQVANLAGPGEFLVSELDWSRVIRDSEKRGLSVIAFVHSHLSSLDMSEADRRCCNAIDLPFVVVRLRGGTLEHQTCLPDKTVPAEGRTP